MVKQFLVLLWLSICSCNNRLNEKRHSFDKLNVRVYTISEITNSYQYVDIAKNKEYHTVFRSNSLSVDSIIFRNDSLFIRTYPSTPLYIYEPKKLGISIIVDTTIDPFKRFREKEYF